MEVVGNAATVAEALAGIFGLDEADIAAKIAEAGAADGDD
jgi:hypothetical protein